MQNAQDFHTAGSAKLAGGVYRNIHVSGSCTLQGKVECLSVHVSGSMHAQDALFCEGKLSVSGSCHIDGASRAGDMHVSGACHIGGAHEGKLFSISGSANVHGDLTATAIKVSGSCHVKESIHSEQINISGTLSAGKDCEAERFKAYQVNIEGLLNAEDVEIILPWGNLGAKPATVGSIGGNRINVHRQEILEGFNLFGLFRTKSLRQLRTKVIEGEDIYLENTVAEVVRGTRVIIGSGCNIKRVEYTQSCDISPDAKVEGQEKTA